MDQQAPVTLWNWVCAAGMAVGVVTFGRATGGATNAYAKQSRVRTLEGAAEPGAAVRA